MKNTTQILQWLLVVVFLVVVANTTSRRIEAKTLVTMANLLGPDLVMNVHCKSKDDDLGPHSVPYKVANYSFRFEPNLWETTQFWCRFLWTGGDHYFDIYIDTRDALKCNEICTWKIYTDGPCMYDRYKEEYSLCHDWNPPK
ncbi:S-protein homolog 5-like [Ziziphus jujuba]|uniref:S-protein homolog n=1 Tax=Ziziphus jujuba TaxID=326968 RepID=A0A6P3YV16_ZIZJJ|nr:S-protein homolog 5-like [Ziziphus jujuba]